MGSAVPPSRRTSWSPGTRGAMGVLLAPCPRRCVRGGCRPIGLASDRRPAMPLLQCPTCDRFFKPPAGQQGQALTAECPRLSGGESDEPRNRHDHPEGRTRHPQGLSLRGPLLGRRPVASIRFPGRRSLFLPDASICRDSFVAGAGMACPWLAPRGSSARSTPRSRSDGPAGRSPPPSSSRP